MDDATRQELLRLLGDQRDTRRRSEDNATEHLGLTRRILEGGQQSMYRALLGILGPNDQVIRLLLSDARRVTAAEIEFAEAVAGREALEALIAEVEAADES